MLPDFSSSRRREYHREREREVFVLRPVSATRGAPSLSFYCRARFPPRGLMRRRQCAFLHALAYRNQWPRVTLRNGDLYRAFFSPHRVTRPYRGLSGFPFFFSSFLFFFLLSLSLLLPLFSFLILVVSLLFLFLSFLILFFLPLLPRDEEGLFSEKEISSRERSHEELLIYLLTCSLTRRLSKYGYRSESYLVFFFFLEKDK